MSDDFWKPLRRVTPADAGIEIRTRMRATISPIIVEQDGPRTRLLRRGTAETRTLPDHATDDEIGAAVDAWCAEIDAAHPVVASVDEQAGTVTLTTPLAFALADAVTADAAQPDADGNVRMHAATADEADAMDALFGDGPTDGRR